MPKKLSLEEINNKLKIEHPNIQAIKRLEKGKVVFWDSEYGEFEGNLTNVTKGRQTHPMRNKTMKNLPVSELNKRLHEKYPYMRILEFKGIQSYHTLLLDDQYGEFKGRLEFVLKGLKFHPKRSKKIRGENCKKHYEYRKEKLKEKYNIENISQLDWVEEKRKNTFKEKYGGHPLKSGTELRNNLEKLFKEKYGGKSSFSSKAIREKSKRTIKERYGEENAMQVKEISKKSSLRRLESMKNQGKIMMIDGLTINEYIEESNKDFKKCWIGRLHREHGEEFVKKYDGKRTYIEQIIKDFIDKKNIDYRERKRYQNRYEADFLLEDKKIIIECDGLYFHNETMKEDKEYHKKKREFFLRNGFKYLCFREDEINQKQSIIFGMIDFHLGNFERVYGRKCKIVSLETAVSNKFFEENHLMGKGRGKTYALVYNDEVVSAIRIVKTNKNIEISRFCSKLKFSVVGGLSKLIKHIERTHNPEVIISFVDARYGNGNSLRTIGFKEETNFVSFKWTNLKNTYHRMNFKGNLGYKAGMSKIWDCGQIRFAKHFV